MVANYSVTLVIECMFSQSCCNMYVPHIEEEHPLADAGFKERGGCNVGV